MNPVPLIALAAVLVGAWMLLAGQAGSGGGAITTEDNESSIIMNPESVLNQVATAVSGDAGLPDMPQSLSPLGRSRLEGYEGFSATPYPDHKGNSIGFGHLIKPGENLTVLTREEASGLLSSDVAWAEDAVRSCIKVALSQGQFDALVSFCFNVGEGAFKRSTIVKRINAGDPGASQEFDRWVFASGQRNAALVARRASERAIYESGYA